MITNFELLLPAFFYQLLKRKDCKFYYDVVENYRLNIEYQDFYQGLKKMILLNFVKFNEFFGSRFIIKYFYSDDIYQKQLWFLKPEKSMLLENLYSYPEKIEAIKIPNSYLITGTFSESYGAIIALHWIKKIKARNPKSIIKLKIHLTDSFAIDENIKSLCEIEIHNKPLNHKELLDEIAKSETLLLPYNWSEAFVGCTPVKLYEALSLNTKVKCTFEENLARKINHPLLTFVDKELNVIDSLSEDNFELLTFNERYYSKLKSFLFA